MFLIEFPHSVNLSVMSVALASCEQAHKHNLEELVALNILCARILAKHDGGAEASKASADMAAGLETEVVLGKGAHVMITRNLWKRKGLGDCSDGENFTCSLVFTGIVNATVGTVEDIIWECGAENSDLPLVVSEVKSEVHLMTPFFIGQLWSVVTRSRLTLASIASS
jgi:hypothetical protein